MTAIVVIAGSVGSLDPIKRILGALRADCAGSIFVVTHTGPHRSVLASLLSRPDGPQTGVPSDGQPIIGGRIYVAPPNMHMTLEFGLVRVGSGPKVHHTRPAADPLFISAAEVYGDRVLGIVLSGGAGDGALGLRRVRERGGIALVQLPSEAEQPSMPLHAILAADPNEVLAVEDIAARVKTFCGDKVISPVGTDSGHDFLPLSQPIQATLARVRSR